MKKQQKNVMFVDARKGQEKVVHTTGDEAINLLEKGLNPYTGQPLEDEEKGEQPAPEEETAATDGRNDAEQIERLEKALQEANERAEKAEIAFKRETPKSIEEILQQAADIQTVGQKLEYLKTKKREIAAFNFGSTQMSESLKITDNNGATFSTQSNTVLTSVKALIVDLLSEKIAEAEAQLKAMA